MKFALEPCLFEYYVFLIKQQGEYHMSSIEEVSSLWKNLAAAYGLSARDENILDKITELSSKIYLDKRVKVIDSMHTDDNSTWIKMDLAHDALIISFLINSPPGTRTDTPWDFWHETYKEVREHRLDLKEIFYHSTVLQTILSPEKREDGSPVDEYIAGRLVSDFIPYKGNTIDSVELPFGKLWRFGVNQKFLFTLTKEHEERASMFLANDFSYVISILGKIENHYLQAVNLYEGLNQMEREAQNLEIQLPEILECEETKLLEVRRSEVDRLGKKAVEMLSSLRICGTNIAANLKNLNSALPDSSINGENFFKNLIEIYSEYQENISSWADVADNILMRINKYTEDTKTKLTEFIQQEKMKESLKIVPETGKPYTESEGDADFGLSKDEYMRTPEEAKSPIGEQSVEWGSNYLFYEDEPENCFDLFKMLCKSDMKSLCISRKHPDKMRKSCEIDDPDVVLYWLSTTTCEFCLPPTLTRISHEISRFLKQNGPGIIMMDGLEFLVNHNDFMQVLKFLDSIKETIIVNRSIMLITLSPNAFSPKELSLIKKNMEVLHSKPVKYDLSKLGL